MDRPPTLPRLSLGQNYPNPFNPSTRFEFNLPESATIEIRVYNLLGQPVATVASGYYQAGTHTATWNGSNENGTHAPSGVYLYELTNEDERVVRKMILLR